VPPPLPELVEPGLVPDLPADMEVLMVPLPRADLYLHDEVPVALRLASSVGAWTRPAPGVAPAWRIAGGTPPMMLSASSLACPRRHGGASAA
jgi:hypothetical protein